METARQSEHLGDQHTDLAAAAILRLHAGEDQIEILVLGIFGDDPGDLERLFAGTIVVGDMGSTVTAHGQGLFHGLLDLLGTNAQHGQIGIFNLFFQLHRLFDGIFIVLVHPPGQIGLVIPGAAGIYLEFRFHIGNLLYTDENFHVFPPVVLSLL